MLKKKWLKIILIILIILLIFLVLWFGLIYPNHFFHEQENLLANAGKRYFEVNKTYFPKEEGRVSSVSLETLLKQKYLDNVYIPYTDKLCDVEKSSVRVINTNGKSEYYTYLKCGNYESSTDHKGPTITLNGKKNMSLSLGEAYQELGVKSVVDDVDGTIDVSKVVIEGEVNTNQVGIYEITYTVTDRLNNKTTVVRTVEVSESLAATVKANTTSNYYIGMAENNYIMFNNMLFRIVRVNDDDTITIVSDDPLANVDYSSQDNNFAGSSLDTWLNDYFYNLLDKEYREKIVPTAWCDDVLSVSMINTTECGHTSKKRNIGILSLQDYNKTLVNNNSYLDLRNLVWYSNFDENHNSWAITSIYNYPNRILSMKTNYLLNVRPALSLASDTKILDGDGSSSHPYIIIKNTSGKKTELINTRKTGEYITYSGYLWRIMKVGNEETTIVMDRVLENNGSEFSIGYTDEGLEKVYNPTIKGNIGYKITYDLTKYVKTDLFAQKEISVPIYDEEITYLGKKEIKKYKVKLSIPSTFDIFSAKGKESSSGGYWCIDSSKRANTKVVVNAIGTTYYDYLDTDDYLERGVKLKVNLLKDVKITGGDGTKDNPYTITR